MKGEQGAPSCPKLLFLALGHLCRTSCFPQFEVHCDLMCTVFPASSTCPDMENALSIGEWMDGRMDG